MRLFSLIRACQSYARQSTYQAHTRVYLQSHRLSSTNNTEDDYPLPEYQERQKEALEVKKARLLYQSRKRGMLENGLLLSTFAAEFLNSFDAKETTMYDKLINKPSNDWEIYYWAIGNKPTPEEFDNKIMDMLKKHASNENLDDRSRQPDL
ncbi:succinate dehydrogenase assembly factor 2, mitochondrial-like [Mytilus californianus]|uniref:succinate dehydrogenase assembly factor 2, mitochondrial-like n=1 Tax=Mytilus californianus TaxID=6549 RepID=UPI0022461BF7|nr:succinate dehydrogenase assembly factor 2, mitochondrial-like [Mytilus californianus]